MIYLYYLKTFFNSFTSIESIIISIIVPVLRKSASQKLFNSIFYYQIVSFYDNHIISQILNIIVIFDVKIIDIFVNYYSEIRQNMKLFNFWINMSLLCVFIQFAYFRISRSLRRKIIHFTMFACLLQFNDFTQNTLEIGILLNQIISTNYEKSFLFKYLKNSKDWGKIPISNILILCSCYYPSFFCIDYEKYVFVLINILILDSFACLTGKFFKSKQKSVKGMLSGIIFAIIFHFIIFRNLQYAFHYSIIGIIEYFVTINDNLIIPICSVLLVQYLKI